MDIASFQDIIQGLAQASQTQFRQKWLQIKAVLDLFTADKLKQIAISDLAEELLQVQPKSENHLDLIEQSLKELIQGCIKYEMKVGYRALQKIFDLMKIPPLYAQTLDKTLRYPFGRDRELQRYYPSTGEECDFVYPNLMDLDCYWSVCHVVEVVKQFQKYRIKPLVSNTGIILYQANILFAKKGTRTAHLVDKLSLKIQDKVDILLGNHWYTGRIVEKLPNNTIVKIKIRPEEQNNNETITLDLQSNRISQQHSFTSKSSNSKIVIDSCSMINFCDCFDLLFQKEFKEKAFFFMARNHFLISSTFLNMCNCFYAVKGLSVLNIHLRNQNSDCDVFQACIIIYSRLLLVQPKMIYQRMKFNLGAEIIKGVQQRAKHWKAGNLQQIMNSLNIILTRISSSAYQKCIHFIQLHFRLIKEYISANLEKQLMALKLIDDLIDYERKSEEQFGVFIVKFLKDQKLFNSVYSPDKHQEVLKKSLNFLLYLVIQNSISEHQIDLLWNSEHNPHRKQAIDVLLKEIINTVSENVCNCIITKIFTKSSKNIQISQLEILRKLQMNNLHSSVYEKLYKNLYKAYLQKPHLKELEDLFVDLICHTTERKAQLTIVDNLLDLLKSNINHKVIKIFRKFITNCQSETVYADSSGDQTQQSQNILQYSVHKGLEDILLKNISAGKQVGEYLSLITYLFKFMKSEHCDRYLLHLSNILKASPEFIRWLADVEEIAKNFIYSLFETVQYTESFKDITLQSARIIGRLFVNINVSFDRLQRPSEVLRNAIDNCDLKQIAWKTRTFQLHGLLFLLELCLKCTQMEVADIFMRMLASICVSYDQDPLHSEEAVNLLISSIVGKLQEIFNKPFHTNNLHILRALVKFLFVLFRETEQQNQLKGKNIFYELQSGKLLSFVVEDKRVSPTVIKKIKVHQFSSLFKLKQQISTLIQCKANQFVIECDNQLLNDDRNGTSIHDLKLKNNHLILLSKNEAEEPHCRLLDEHQEDKLSPKLKQIISKWFAEVAEDNRMCPEKLSLLCNKRWKGTIFDGQLLCGVYSRCDRNEKGYFLLDEFEAFFVDIIKQDLKMTWKFLKECGYSNNLHKPRSLSARETISEDQFSVFIFNILEKNYYQEIHEDLYRLQTNLLVNAQYFEAVRQMNLFQIFSFTNKYYLLLILTILSYLVSKEQGFAKQFSKIQENIVLLEEQFPTYLAIGSKEKINGRIFLQIIEIINKYLSFAYSGSLMATIITEKDWQNVLTLEMLRDSEQIEYNAEKRQIYLEGIGPALDEILSVDINLEKLDSHSIETIAKIIQIKLLLSKQGDFEEIAFKKITHKSPQLRRLFQNALIIWLHCLEPDKKQPCFLFYFPQFIKFVDSTYFDKNSLPFVTSFMQLYMQDCKSQKGLSQACHTVSMCLQRIIHFTSGTLQQHANFQANLIILESIFRWSTQISIQFEQLTELFYFITIFDTKRQINHCAQFKKVKQGFKQMFVNCRTPSTRDLALKILYYLLKHTLKIYFQRYKNIVQQVISVSLHKSSQVKAKNLRVGLYNIRNICYLNSILQLLYGVQPFRVGIITHPFDQKLSYGFKKVFLSLQMSDRAYHVPDQFLQYFDPPIDPNIQQDTSEFFHLIEQTLSQQLPEYQFSKMFSNIFSGDLAVQMVCMKCKKESKKLQHFLLYNIDIIGNNHLNEALYNSNKPEMINDYSCSHCKIKTNMQKTTSVSKLPPYLIVNLKRIHFSYDLGRNIKIHHRFQFPLQIDMAPLMNPSDRKNKNKNNVIMTLKGMIIHSGTGEQGHYYVIAQQDGRWLRLNDKEVTSFDLQNMSEECFGTNDQIGDYSTNAYILLYQMKHQLKGKGYNQTKLSIDTYQIMNTINADNRVFMLEQHYLSEEYYKPLYCFFDKLIDDLAENYYATRDPHVSSLLSEIYKRFMVSICPYNLYVGGLMTKLIKHNKIFEKIIPVNKAEMTLCLFSQSLQLRQLAKQIIIKGITYKLKYKASKNESMEEDNEDEQLLSEIVSVLISLLTISEKQKYPNQYFDIILQPLSLQGGNMWAVMLMKSEIINILTQYRSQNMPNFCLPEKVILIILELLTSKTKDKSLPFPQSSQSVLLEQVFLNRILLSLPASVQFFMFILKYSQDIFPNPSEIIYLSLSICKMLVSKIGTSFLYSPQIKSLINHLLQHNDKYWQARFDALFGCKAITVIQERCVISCQSTIYEFDNNRMNPALNINSILATISLTHINLNQAENILQFFLDVFNCLVINENQQKLLYLLYCNYQMLDWCRQYVNNLGTEVSQLIQQWINSPYVQQESTKLSKMTHKIASVHSLIELIQRRTQPQQTAKLSYTKIKVLGIFAQDQVITVEQEDLSVGIFSLSLQFQETKGPICQSEMANLTEEPAEEIEIEESKHTDDAMGESQIQQMNHQISQATSMNNDLQSEGKHLRYLIENLIKVEIKKKGGLPKKSKKYLLQFNQSSSNLIAPHILLILEHAEENQRHEQGLVIENSISRLDLCFGKRCFSEPMSNLAIKIIPIRCITSQMHD